MKAVRLFERGFSQAEVARRCGVTRQTASVWFHTLRSGGRAALKPTQGGRTAKLNAAQLRKLEKQLLRGAQAHGWSSDLWTLERIAKLIEQLFGVQYHPGHVWKLLRAMGWSLQRPALRARERDEAAILRWKKKAWPQLKKTPEAERSSS
jgi:transposase